MAYKIKERFRGEERTHTITADHLGILEFLWQNDYMNNGWEVKKVIHVTWLGDYRMVLTRDETFPWVPAIRCVACGWTAQYSSGDLKAVHHSCFGGGRYSLEKILVQEKA